MLSLGLLSKFFQAESGKVGKSSKLKDLKKVFSRCARVLKQGQSLLFLNTIRLLRLFLPQVKLLRTWEIFCGFSPRTGSLEHAPVSGKLVVSSLRGLHWPFF